MKNKKGQFGVINSGMIAFITFVLVAITVILLVSITKSTDIVCPETWDTSDGFCLTCPGAMTYSQSNNTCWNATANDVAYLEYDGSAYNATKEMETAAALPPQFAQIIVIVVIIVGILGLLVTITYVLYQQFER